MKIGYLDPLGREALRLGDESFSAPQHMLDDLKSLAKRKHQLKSAQSVWK